MAQPQARATSSGQSRYQWSSSSVKKHGSRLMPRWTLCSGQSASRIRGRRCMVNGSENQMSLTLLDSCCRVRSGNWKCSTRSNTGSVHYRIWNGSLAARNIPVRSTLTPYPPNRPQPRSPQEPKKRPTGLRRWANVASGERAATMRQEITKAVRRRVSPCGPVFRRGTRARRRGSRCTRDRGRVRGGCAGVAA